MLLPLLQTNLTSLKRIHQGKVRDIYDIDAQTMLLVSTDRLSAFDVILPTGIANKGAMLTQMANFWFEKLKAVVPNHLTGIDPLSVVSAKDEAQLGADKRSVLTRSMVCVSIS